MKFTLSTAVIVLAAMASPAFAETANASEMSETSEARRSIETIARTISPSRKNPSDAK